MPAIVLAALNIDPRVLQFLHERGVLALFVLVLLQDVGVPTLVPGTLLVLFGGFLVSQGTIELHTAAVAIAVGAFIGASGMFFLARFGGRPVVLRVGKFIGLTEKRLDGAAVALDRWGPPMLLITRVAPGTRVYMTLFAGVSGWTYRRFALWTGIFAIAWAYAFVLLGAALGNNIEMVATFIQRFSIIALIIALVLALVVYGVRFIVTDPRTRESTLALNLSQVLRRLRLMRPATIADSTPEQGMVTTKRKQPS